MKTFSELVRNRAYSIDYPEEVETQQEENRN